MRYSWLNSIITIALVALAVSTTAQNCCTNLGFETQTFTGWQGGTGFYSNCCPTPGIINGRHTLMINQGTDQNTCNQLSFIPPGFNQSVRLGNSQVGSEAENLSINICVDSLNPILIYRYAIVLADPGHNPDEQPKFDFRVLDANGDIIDSLCAYYEVSAQSNLPGFQTCVVNNGPLQETIVWRDWTPVGVDLSPYVGQNLTIEFTTYDCNLGQHFGYAYFVAECASSEIIVDKCLGDSTVTLTAPEGFEYLWNTGATTRSTQIVNPDTTSVYSVVLTSPLGCQFTLTTPIETTLFYAEIEVQDSCANSFQAFSTDSVLNNFVTEHFWNFGDGTGWAVGSQAQTHQYSSGGSYVVQLALRSVSGCWDTISRPVQVLNQPVPDFTHQFICEGDSFYLINTTQSVNPFYTQWNFDGQTYQSVDFGFLLNDTGSYDVELIVTDDITGCSESKFETFYVYPKPELTFDSLPQLCQNDDWINLNDYSTANMIGLGQYNGLGVQGVIFVPSSAPEGMHEVTYVYRSPYGCKDSVMTTIEILETPSILTLPVDQKCEQSTAVNLKYFTLVNGATDVSYIGPGVSDTLFVPELAGAGSHLIGVVAQNSLTGCADTAFLPISVIDNPPIDIPDPITLCVYDDPIQYPNFYPQGGEYKALFDSLAPWINPLVIGPGEHYLIYEYEFIPDCTTVDSIQILIKEDNCLCSIYYPTVFTPNNDDLNDTWVPVFDCSFESYDLRVYDRWGQLVFSSTDPYEEWDGRVMGGELATTDTYIVQFTYTTSPIETGAEWKKEKRKVTKVVNLLR